MNARIAVFTVAVAGAFTLAGAAELDVGPPTPTPARTPNRTQVEVQMTAATLGDDCGGGRLHVPTMGPGRRQHEVILIDMAPLPAKREKSNNESKGRAAKRHCEQTSMQLSVFSPEGAARTELRVRKVELLDTSGRVLQELTPRTPTRWGSNGAYITWDEKVDPASELSVSYALSEPNWSRIPDRWNQTFVLRATINVAGGSQTLERDVVASAATSLPPNVKT